MYLSLRLRRNSLLLILLLFGLGACSNSSNIGGVNSASGITDRFNAITVHPFQITSTTVSCNPGEQMLSGGWAITTSAYNGPIDFSTRSIHVEKYFVAGSFPASATSWSAIFTNEATGTNQGDILGTVHVECRSQGQAPTIVKQMGTDPTKSTVNATCPNGSSLTGGGYELTNLTAANLAVEIVDFEASAPITHSQWSVSTNVNIAALMLARTNVASFAVCNTGLTTSLGANVTVSAPSGAGQQPTQGTVSASCSSGEVPVGSGYIKVNNFGDTFTLTTFYPDYGSTPPSWDVTAFSLPSLGIDSPPSSTGGSAKIIPICSTLKPISVIPRKN